MIGVVTRGRLSAMLLLIATAATRRSVILATTDRPARCLTHRRRASACGSGWSPARAASPVPSSHRCPRTDAADVQPPGPLAGGRPIHRRVRGPGRGQPGDRADIARRHARLRVAVGRRNGTRGTAPGVPACRIGMAGNRGGPAPGIQAVPAVIRAADGVAHDGGPAVTGRTRWWLAAGVGLGLVLAAPVACRAPHTPDDGRGVLCAPRHRARTGQRRERPGHRRHERLRRRLFRAADRRGVPVRSRPTCASGSSTGSRGS